MKPWAALALLTGAAALAQDITQVKRTPLVVKPGVHATLQFEIKTTGAFDRLVLIPAWANTTQLPFTNAAQNTWTISIPVASWLATAGPDKVYRPFVGFVRFFQGNTQLAQFNLFGQYMGPEIARVPLTQDAADVQHTPYVANIRVPAAFPDPNGPGPRTYPNIDQIAKRFYQFFPDDFDQLDIVYHPEVRDNRFHMGVKQQVSGVGQSPFNNSAQYGSGGRLEGINIYGIPVLFDGAEEGNLHEFGHQWVNFLNFAPFVAGVPHWPTSTMARGIMGLSIPGGVGGNFPCILTASGSKLTGTGGAEVANEAKVFTDFDLYLMGLVPPAEVAEQYVITDAATASTVAGNCGAPIPDNAWRRVTVNEMVAGAGARVPNSANARHDFRRATIVVSRDALLTADEMDFYTYFARRGEERAQVLVTSGLAPAKMTNPFYLATGKRGTMMTRLAQTGWPVIPPGSVVNGASYTPAIGRGSFVSIFGSGFISSGAASTPTAALPLTLANSVVYVNGVQVPLYYVSADQVNFQLPFDTPLGKASVTLVTPLGPTNAAWIDVTAAAPGILFYDSHRAVAQNQDYSLNGPSNGAAPGSYVTVYLTGIGPLDTAVATGAPAPSEPLARATSNARATLGSTEVPIVYLGLTPGYAGLAQLNLQIPANLPPGDYVLTLTIGSAVSNQVLIRIG